MTKIYYLEECHNGGHHKYTTIEINDIEAEEWIERDYQIRLSEANDEDKANVQRRTCQQIVDAEINNPYRADWVRHQRHEVSGLTYTNDEGDEISVLDNIADDGPTPEEYVENQFAQEDVDRFLSTLTEVQRRRTLMVWDGMTVSEIARAENKDVKTIVECLEAVEKKRQKFLK